MYLGMDIDISYDMLLACTLEQCHPYTTQFLEGVIRTKRMSTRNIHCEKVKEFAKHGK